jgi:hypothetical protein
VSAAALRWVRYSSSAGRAEDAISSDLTGARSHSQVLAIVACPATAHEGQGSATSDFGQVSS